MKIVTTLILFLVIFSQLNAQNKRGPCGSNIQHVQVLNGIIFIPKNPQSNKSEEEIQFCRDYVNIYNIDGLELSEKLFLDLHLKQKDVIESKTYYSYGYKNNDTLNCIETLDLFVSLNISIKLNGIELKPDEKEIALKKIQTGQLNAIKSIRKVFGKVTIEITTQ